MLVRQHPPQSKERQSDNIAEYLIQSDMESLEMDLECRRSIQESKALAGIFQSIVQDCKVSTVWKS